MTPLIRYWLDICLLRAGPQDGPASAFILGFAITCYTMVSVLVMSGNYGMLTGTRIALAELAMLVMFIALLLYLLGKAARIRQTLSAMTGAGTLLGLFALPLAMMFQSARVDDSLPFILSFAWLTLLFWNLVVSAHIMRHALSTTFAIGFAVSLVYVLISTQLVMALFPQPDEIGLAR